MNINKLQIEIILNFLFKGTGLIISFITVPFTLKYLGEEKYGFWMLILSIVVWVNSFDIGIGNSLKNKIVEFRENQDIESAKKNIASGYFGVFTIACILFAIGVVFLKILTIEDFIKSNVLTGEQIKNILEINIFFICLNFFLGICNSIFIGFQKSYIASFNIFFYQVLSLIFILILIKFYGQEKLINLSIFYGVASILPNILTTIIFFKKNRQYLFSYKDISLKKMKSLLNIGIKMFIMQFCGLIIFFTDSWMISSFIGIEKVGEYGLVNKLFSVFMVFFGILLAPIWPAVTQAYYRKDKEGIENIIKKMRYIYILISLGILVGIIFAQKFIFYWTLKKIYPSFILIVLTGVSSLIINYTNIYATIILGIGNVKNIMILNIFQASFNVLFSYIFVKKFNFGINGIILATCLCLVINIYVYPREIKNLLKKI